MQAIIQVTLVTWLRNPVIMQRWGVHRNSAIRPFNIAKFAIVGPWFRVKDFIFYFIGTWKLQRSLILDPAGASSLNQALAKGR